MERWQMIIAAQELAASMVIGGRSLSRLENAVERAVSLPVVNAASEPSP